MRYCCCSLPLLLQVLALSIIIEINRSLGDINSILICSAFQLQSQSQFQLHRTTQSQKAQNRYTFNNQQQQRHHQSCRQVQDQSFCTITSLRNHQLHRNNPNQFPISTTTTCSSIVTSSHATTTTSTTRTTSLFVSSPKNNNDWDSILVNDNNDDDDDDDDTIIIDTNVPFDMKYNKRNCDRSNKNFIAIKDAHGPINDVYCRRIPDNEIPGEQFEQDVFWFIGKVARVSDISIEQCIHRQYHLLLQHAGFLRPLELYTAVKTNRLELWIAPGDTEIEVAYNRPTIQFIKINQPPPPPPPTTTTTTTENNNNMNNMNNNKNAFLIKNSFVGFQGEVYGQGEEGFRTLRKYDGSPAKPEIQQQQQQDEEEEANDNNDADTDDDSELDEFRMPNDEEMEKIYKALEGKDINEIYEKQQQQQQQQKLPSDK